MSSSGVKQDVSRNSVGISTSLGLPTVNTAIQARPLNLDQMYFDVHTRAVVYSFENKWKVVRNA